MHYLAVAGLTAVLAGALAWMISRLKPRRLEGDAGTIVPERWTAIVTCLFGLALGTFGIIGLIAGDWKLGFPLSLFGLAVTGFMAPSLTDLHRVEWTAESVEGPCRLFGPTLGLRRTRIGWSEVVSTGRTITDYWFIQSADGRRIYWSYLYRGYGALVASLQEHCPNVALPSDPRMVR